MTFPRFRGQLRYALALREPANWRGLRDLIERRGQRRSQLVLARMLLRAGPAGAQLRRVIDALGRTVTQAAAPSRAGAARQEAPWGANLPQRELALDKTREAHMHIKEITEQTFPIIS